MDVSCSMVGRKKMEDTQQVALRLANDLIRRADAYAAALSADHPGMNFTRTDALRIVLAKHLPPLPSEATEPEKPSAAPARSKSDAVKRPRR